MLFRGQQKVCIALCTPMPMHEKGGRMVHEPISPLWHRHRTALSLPSNINTVELFADGMEVGDARSRVARQCLDMTPTPEFLFFLDYDVMVPSDALAKLFFRARTLPNYDVYAGVYCLKRGALPEPLIYGEHGQGPLWDWTVGDLLTTESHGVKSVHMGLTLLRVSAFQRLLDAKLVSGDGTDQEGTPFYKTVNESRTVKAGMSVLQMGTEDIWFCDLLHRLGGKILVDTSVLAGHHDKGSGITYGLPHLEGGPVKRAKWLPDGKGGSADQAEGLKLALDIGAGGERRQWEGHKTYTTDIRADTHPDYVMDTRLLNLPDAHFDLVASSHHLEHIGRWEQEQVWREMARVLKPGGKMEHTVPSLDWAAAKVREGKVDGHVLNVLYGAQEAHGYERTFNLHYFGYTKEIAQALAEQAGLVDVTCEDWRDRPEMGYNLIIRATKPVPVEAQPTPEAQPEPIEMALPEAQNSAEEIYVCN